MIIIHTSTYSVFSPPENAVFSSYKYKFAGIREELTDLQPLKGLFRVNMTTLNRKKTFSKTKSWILYTKNYEIQQQKAFSSTYSNLFAYGANNPVKYTDPDGRTNYLVISTFQGGGRENQGTNFDDAAATRANEIKSSSSYNPKTDSVILKKIDSVSELKDLLKDGNIDSLEMYGHGTEDKLCIGSGEGPGKREYLTKENLSELNPKAFNKGATIKLNQCNTANENKISFFSKMFGKQTIAKDISDYFGVTVTGNKGGSTGVPSPDAEVDYNWVHKSGDPIYYKATAGTETYEK